MLLEWRLNLISISFLNCQIIIKLILSELLATCAMSHYNVTGVSVVLCLKYSELNRENSPKVLHKISQIQNSSAIASANTDLQS